MNRGVNTTDFLIDRAVLKVKKLEKPRRARRIYKSFNLFIFNKIFFVTFAPTLRPLWFQKAFDTAMCNTNQKANSCFSSLQNYK